VDLRNDLDDLPKLTGMLIRCGEQFRIPEPLVRQLELALDEIVTNIISYAYPDGGAHVIRVDVGVDDSGITAIVEDDGVPFNPLDREAPDTTAPIEDRGIGGLGIHLVRELMDDVRYDRIGTRNRLTITKAIRAV
jgi:anti-sigma regulatory factor (Ser/Thr protein kinase)